MSDHTNHADPARNCGRTMVQQQQRANIFAYAVFDVKALITIARDIRQKLCSCDESQCPKSGSLNWVIFLVFEDGVEWVFRSPRKSYGLQEDIASEALASEVATLKYLEKAGSIPVSRVLSYRYLVLVLIRFPRRFIQLTLDSASHKNSVGVPYILMSKASSVPLSTYHWDDMIPKSTLGTDSKMVTLTSSQR